MISLNEFLVNNKINRKIDNYSYQPTSKIELIKNIEELINNGEYDLNCIDTSKITDMSNLFFNTDIINADIANINFDVSKWNVSNVKDMSYMFCQCVKFNCDLSNWDVSNVKDMSCMFSDCQYFNKPLNDWDVSNVKDMSGMFSFCHKFNQPLNNWDVSNVETTDNMFFSCKKFNQSLDVWNVSNVCDMSNMFRKCTSLKNIPKWYE